MSVIVTFVITAHLYLSSESIFRGWQLLCVLLVTFPPSKNFEAYLRAFMEQHVPITTGRVDVMAKYCIQRLSIISKKGPRGKALAIAEIETASVSTQDIACISCSICITSNLNLLLSYRTRRSIHLHSGNHWIVSIVSKSAHILNSKYQSSSHSLPTVFSH